jgi:S-adenosylmethionine hydrolase
MFSFHIILLNLFDKPVQHLLIAKHNNQFIICADNGILTMIAGKKPKEIVAIPVPKQQNVLQLTEVMATAICDLANNNGTVRDGYFIQNIVEKYPLRATLGPDWMEGQILFIDHFENVIINITESEFEAQRNGRKFKIVFKRNEVIEEISNSYANVDESEKLALFNSAGYLEIAINQGNMAGLFGLQGFNEKMASVQNKWFYQTVRIFFE